MQSYERQDPTLETRAIDAFIDPFVDPAAGIVLGPSDRELIASFGFDDPPVDESDVDDDFDDDEDTLVMTHAPVVTEH